MRGIVLIAAVAIALAPWVHAQDRPVFRSDTQTVFVSASVKKGNTPIAALRAEDFVLSDNGVPQRVDAVSIEAVPIDVSLFIDTSGSTSIALDQMRITVRDIAAMLRPGDRFRLLTIGLSLYRAVDWTEAGRPVELPDIFPVSGISLVYDALYAATAHVVEVGRRHLVVAFTDGDDECSVVRPAELRSLIGRTEAVVHWVPMGGVGAERTGLSMLTCGRGDADRTALDALVQGTGGAVHSGLLGGLGGARNGGPVKAFKDVLDDYRASYVLHYTPEGVARPGWHQLKVGVASGNYTISARSGNFGE